MQEFFNIFFQKNLSDYYTPAHPALRLYVQDYRNTVSQTVGIAVLIAVLMHRVGLEFFDFVGG